MENQQVTKSYNPSIRNVWTLFSSGPVFRRRWKRLLDAPR